MNLTPITATVASFADIPHMLENGWEPVMWSEAQQKCVMRKPGAWKLDDTTKLPEALEPKKGEDGAGKPVEVDQIPVEPPVEL